MYSKGTFTSRGSHPSLKGYVVKRRRPTLKLRRAGKKKTGKSSQKIRKQVNNRTRTAHRHYINELTNTGNTKTFWRYVRSRRKDDTGVQPLKVNNQLLTDDQDKAQALSNQFESVFTRENKDVPNPSMTGNPFPEMPPIIVDIGGVRKLLANIDTSKAIGPDQIPNQALKLAADEIAPVLQHIFQQSLDSGVLPEDWKRAQIAAIYKKGDTTNPANYRPVSLTLCLL